MCGWSLSSTKIELGFTSNWKIRISSTGLFTPNSWRNACYWSKTTFKELYTNTIKHIIRTILTQPKYNQNLQAGFVLLININMLIMLIKVLLPCKKIILFLYIIGLHPGRLTWNLRIHPWKIPNHHFQVRAVNHRGCIFAYLRWP